MYARNKAHHKFVTWYQCYHLTLYISVQLLQDIMVMGNLLLVQARKGEFRRKHRSLPLALSSDQFFNDSTRLKPASLDTAVQWCLKGLRVGVVVCESGLSTQFNQC